MSNRRQRPVKTLGGALVVVTVVLVAVGAASCGTDAGQQGGDVAPVDQTVAAPVGSGSVSEAVIEFNEALLAGDAIAAEELLLPRLDAEGTGAMAEFHVSTVPGPLGAGGPGFPGTMYNMNDPFPWSGLYLDDLSETEVVGSDGDAVTVRWVYQRTAPAEGWEFWCNWLGEGPSESPAFIVDPGATAVVAYENEITVSDDGLITRIEGTECGELVSDPEAT